MTRKPSSPVSEADVYRSGERVGVITRTSGGSVLRYTDEFYRAHASLPGGLALHLPYAPREIETRGYNLHPYFAGLLPEGMRLKALIRRTKTSEDDLLTLLASAGMDTIGDLAVAARGTRPASRAAELEPASADQVRFAELWSRVTEGQDDETPIPGVQDKISPATISFPVAAHSTRAAYILKLEPADRPRIVENEFFFMQAARAAGVTAAKTWLVRDRDGAPGLLVERFDRHWDPARRRLLALHVEDGCQLLDRYPADKYAVTCRDIAEALESTTAPVASRAALLRLIAFSYVICNGDLHAKNVSVVNSPAGWVLAPAYDLLTTWPYGDRSMAMSLEGRDKNLHRKHFVAFGARFGVPERAVAAILDRVRASVPDMTARLGEIGLEKRREADLARAMAKRAEDIA